MNKVKMWVSLKVFFLQIVQVGSVVMTPNIILH